MLRLSGAAGYLRKHGFSPVVPFLLLHVACLYAFWLPPTWNLVALAAATYAVRIFGISAGYHRYFAHRTFKLDRFSQFLLAFLAQSSAQKGVLWWASHHRRHHRESDTIRDVHSPVVSGFWRSHVGWIVSGDFDDYDANLIRDFGRFPELRWLTRYHWVPTAVLAVGLYLAGGFPAFFWGYVVSTVVLYHATFSINSLAHLWGSQRFDTGDQSRNNLWLALITFGEGWHNNHHHQMHLCRQGLYWWEIDLTYYLLRALGAIGIVRDLKEPREAQKAA